MPDAGLIATVLLPTAGDGLQTAAQAFTSQDAVTRDLTIFFALALVFVMAAGWVLVALWRRQRITLSSCVRVALIMVVSYGLARLLHGLLIDPRPYLLEHITPIVHVSADNGFPSDHVLLGSALAATLWWIDRRLIPAFTLLVALVMLGRLGIAAHHSLDVLGSAGIVALVSLIVAWLPLPEPWSRLLAWPLVPRLWKREGASLPRKGA